MNAFDQMREALTVADQVQRAADNNADKMARMIAGRLRVAGVSSTTLRALKHELRTFNMTTGGWK